MTKKRITIRLNQNEYGRLKHLRSANKLNSSSVIRALLLTSDPKNYLANYKKMNLIHSEVADLETKVNSKAIKTKLILNYLKSIQDQITKLDQKLPESVVKAINNDVISIKSICFNKPIIKEMTDIDTKKNQLQQ